MDRLHERELTGRDQEGSDLAFPVLDGERETVLAVAVLSNRVTSTDSDQVLDNVSVARICCNVNRLATTCSRLDARIELVLDKQVLYNIEVAGDTSQVETCNAVLRRCKNFGPKLHQYLAHGEVASMTSVMQRSEFVDLLRIHKRILFFLDLLCLL